MKETSPQNIMMMITTVMTKLTMNGESYVASLHNALTKILMVQILATY